MCVLLHLLWSADNLWGSVVSFRHVDLKYRVQITDWGLAPLPDELYCTVNGNPAEVHECTHYGHVRINFAFKTAVTYPCSHSPSEYFSLSFQGTKKCFSTENKSQTW